MQGPHARFDDTVRAVAWLDATTCLVADAAGAVHHWRPRSQLLEPLTTAGPQDRGGVVALAVDDTGTRVAVGWECGGVLLLGTSGAAELQLREPVVALSFGPGPWGLLAAASHHDVLVVDDEGETVVAEWYRAGAVAALCWVDDTLLAIGGHGGVTFLSALEIPDSAAPATLPSPGVVLDLRMDAAGRMLTAADLRGEVRITDLRSGDELSLDGLGDRARGAAWFGGDRLLAVASDDELTVWERAPEDLEPEPWIHGPVSGPSTRPEVSGDGTRVAVGGHDGTVLVVHADDPGAASTVVDLDSGVRSLAWRPGGDDLAIGTAGGSVVLLSC
jgi:WD40 repeat protein